MRKIPHLSGYGVLPSFKYSTLPHETKAQQLKYLPIKTLLEVPGPKGIYNVPFVGNALAIYPYLKNRDFQLYFRELYKKYGKMVRIRLGSQNCLMLYDPELISQAIAHEGIYPERYPVPIMDSYVKRTHRCLLSQTNGPDWQKYRSTAQLSIKPNIIKHYVEVQSPCADDLVTWIKNHGSNNPNVKDAFLRFSADANSVVTFDKKMGFLKSLESPDPELELFLHSVHQFMASIGESLFSLPWYKLWRTKTYTEFEDAAETVYRISGKYIDAVRQEMNKRKDGIEESDADESNLTVLKMLLRDDRITNEMVTNLMAALVFAGVEQVSQFLMWMFWLLGKSPEKQDKLYDEISTNSGSASLAASHLGHLPYLKACVKESFRCVPPLATGIARILPQDTEIGGYLIPKRTTVFFGNNTLSMSGELFEDPDQFLPERWLEGTDNPQTQRQMGLCVLPFGMGKRNCLGRRLAEQEIHLATIKILQNFKVEITQDCRNVRPKYTLFAEPDTPITFNFTRRL